jgi:uncharacterized coiled-coil protein SlyX
MTKQIDLKPELDQTRALSIRQAFRIRELEAQLANQKAVNEVLAGMVANQGMSGPAVAAKGERHE